MLKEISLEISRPVAQIALNWVMQRPTVASVLIGARNQQQLQENLATDQFTLNQPQLDRLNQVSSVYPPYPYYPYWNGQFSERYQSLVHSNFLEHMK